MDTWDFDASPISFEPIETASLFLSPVEYTTLDLTFDASQESVPMMALDFEYGQDEDPYETFEWEQLVDPLDWTPFEDGAPTIKAEEARLVLGPAGLFPLPEDLRKRVLALPGGGSLSILNVTQNKKRRLLPRTTV